MLELKYNDITTEIMLGSFYSHELMISKLPNLGAGKITLIYTHELDADLNNQTLLSILLILKNLQDRRHINRINLEFNYMPFSRMDKQDNEYEETLRPFLMLIEPMIDVIITKTIHSSKIFDMLFDGRHVNDIGIAFRNAERKYMNTEDSAFVSVDNGVSSRYNRHFSISIQKKRVNGQIVEQYINDYDIDIVKNISEFVFVDDICSKGTTFMNAGKLIRDINPNAKLHLYVEFMEKSAYEAGLTKPLFDMFDTVDYQQFI